MLTKQMFGDIMGTETSFKAWLVLLNDILLVDMNSFFASVHQSLDVSLRGKAVIVCGDPAKRHGIVLAASYEAKNYGVKTGMQVWEAERLVPWGVFVRPNHITYSEFSQRFFKVLNQFSPLVEPMSIDEAFVDVSGSSAKTVGTA